MMVSIYIYIWIPEIGTPFLGAARKGVGINFGHFFFVFQLPVSFDLWSLVCPVPNKSR